MRNQINVLCHFLLLWVVSSCTHTPVSEGRVKTNLAVPYEAIGVLSPKSIHEVKNDLTLGCEVLDRDYADYHQYKEYIVPLGLKKIRLQAGWAKTEKIKGVYDFAWLDSIINDAVGRGIKICYRHLMGTPSMKVGEPPI